MKQGRYVLEILLPLALEHTFSYLCNEEASIGQLVEVNFVNRKIIGVVWNIKENEVDTCKLTESSHLNSSIKRKKLKYISDLINTNIISPLSKDLMGFITWVAKYTTYPRGMVLKMTLPLKYKEITKLIDSKIKEKKNDILNRENIEDKSNTTLKFELNEDQSLVAKSILNEQCYKYSVSVLDGVTGSGKTEVFLWVAEKLAHEGGQILILLPEIVLTTQLLARLKEKLPKHINLQNWHSGLTPAQKRKTFDSVQNGSLQILVGARSALFLPFKNLKLIVIDEEHDTSFKQEEHVIYNARDMAIVRAKLHNIPIILSSATPSIETIFNANQQQSNQWKHYKLHKRYSGVMMPEIQIVDLNTIQIEKPSNTNNINNTKKNNSKNTNKNVWIHQISRKTITETLNSGKQSLIFINRRGYAPTIFCKQCSNKIMCPSCSFGLTYHKSNNTMHCHYCDYKTKYLNICPTCKSTDSLINYGPGVERIAEEINAFLPNSKILTLTSDTMKTPKQISDAINKIENHEVDIIVGTQIIAKGLHFDKLQLVVVVDADPNSVGSDLRALERTYQMLQQVMGRAGRKDERGKVILQTHEPKSEVLQYIVKDEKEKFINLELNHRKIAHMPPYSRLAIINFSSKNEMVLLEYLQKLRKSLPYSDDRITYLGPAASPVKMMHGNYRYRLIIKCDKNINIQNVVKQLLAQVKFSSKIFIKTDIDPYSFE